MSDDEAKEYRDYKLALPLRAIDYVSRLDNTYGMYEAMVYDADDHLIAGFWFAQDAVEFVEMKNGEKQSDQTQQIVHAAAEIGKMIVETQRSMAEAFSMVSKYVTEQMKKQQSQDDYTLADDEK